MDIKRAKEEIKNAISAYLLKDEYGEYVIPSVRQRPIFLIGAPGIGKHRLWSRLQKSADLELYPTRLHIIQGKVQSDCRLFQNTFMERKSIRLRNIR